MTKEKSTQEALKKTVAHLQARVSELADKVSVLETELGNTQERVQTDIRQLVEQITT